ncbi:MAG: hypothetical protein H7Y30_13330 [Pyrinomonadaceae bacterium]|nr:hypothetical protein [Pyrinomonadaceae bacterium]
MTDIRGHEVKEELFDNKRFDALSVRGRCPKARMKDEGGRMKVMLLNLELHISNSMPFILHPSAFILAFHPCFSSTLR